MRRDRTLRPSRAAWPAFVLVTLLAAPASAHELRPGYLDVQETAADRYRVVWKQPARGDLRLAIDPVKAGYDLKKNEKV